MLPSKNPNPLIYNSEFQFSIKKKFHPQFLLKLVKREILILFLLFFLFGTFQKAIANDMAPAKFRENVYRGFSAIYNFRFIKADSIIKNLRKDFPEMAGTYILTANYYWWLIISGEDSKSARINYLANLELALQKISNEKPGHLCDDDIYNLISIYGYKARLDAMNKNYIKAFKDIHDCISVLKLSFDRENTYEPYNLTSGLYNYMIGQVKKKYPFLVVYTVFLPHASKTKGLALLEKIATSDDEILFAEANYFLMKINLEEEENINLTENYCVTLTNAYNSNLLYKYYYFKTLLLNGKKDEAQKQFEILIQESNSNNELTLLQKKHFAELARKNLSE
jgi:hypothetical protein